MQRLIARIKDEFSTSKITAAEIKVLNGSGGIICCMFFLIFYKK